MSKTKKLSRVEKQPEVPAPNDWRGQMKERADAELQAKLAMVRMQAAPPYGRRPRKIGTMYCDTGIKVGYTTQNASFILRLDDGEFIAEHGDVWYISASRDALQAKMNQVARVTFDLQWTRYLEVRYKALVPYKDSWHSENSLDLDDKREKNQVVYGVSLRWEVVEYSNAINLPGDEEKTRWMKRDVDEDGEPSQQQESVRELPTGLIPYTKEREALLNRIRAVFGTIDRKMIEMLGGAPEQIAKRLDAMNGPLLLEAPKKEKKR